MMRMKTQKDLRNFLEDDDDDIAEIDSEEVEVEAEVEGPQMEENVLQSTVQ